MADPVDPAVVYAVAREPPAAGVPGRMDEGQPPAVEEVVPRAPRSIKLLDLPTKVLLLILESLLAVGPITLLGSVPGVCRRLRALCAGVHGEFDLRHRLIHPLLRRPGLLEKGDNLGVTLVPGNAERGAALNRISEPQTDEHARGGAK